LAYPVAAASAHRDCLDPHLLTHELREDRAGWRAVVVCYDDDVLGGKWLGYVGEVTVAGDVGAAAIQRCENVGEVPADDISEAVAVVVLGPNLAA
jgi:hypothetical protein